MRGGKIKNISKLLIVLLLSAGILPATPFISNGGFITPQGRDDIKANFFYEQYTGSYDGNGIYSEFAPGNARLDYTVLFDLKYGTGRDSDVQITLPYVKKLQTIPGGLTFGATGFGDLTVIGRQKSNESKTTEAMLTLGVGAKVPTGKSIFIVDKEALATGTGTWDVGVVLNMQENNNGILLFTDLSYWYRFGLSAQKFAGFDISAIKPGETEVKFSPGGVFKYNFGVELPVIKLLSVVGELNGEVFYESKAEYGSNNADALADLTAKNKVYSTPDFTLEKSINIRVAAGIKIYVNDKVALGGGVSLPVNTVNAFGNITYIAHCRLIF